MHELVRRCGGAVVRGLGFDAGELSRVSEVVCPCFRGWYVFACVDFFLGEIFLSSSKKLPKQRTHPLLQMPLVKSKHTPAVLGRGGIWPLGGRSCEKRQCSPRLHCPRV